MSDDLDEIFNAVLRISDKGSQKNQSSDKKKAILKLLKELEEDIKTRKKQEKKNGKRIQEILSVIMSLATLKYDKKVSITNERNDLDALAIGINMLGEELKSSTVSLKEKEILLKEVHHRVKNNLQVISSLLSLQSESITNPELLKIFTDCQNRVKSMALVHEKLYESEDFSRIDFTQYLHSFISYLDASHNLKPDIIKLHFDYDKEPYFLKIDIAIACGLILNELISNSCKYAFPGNKTGNIYISFFKVKQNTYSSTFVLKVSDDGIGIPSHIEISNANSLGLQLINLLTQQIRGTMDLDVSAGTQFTIYFEAEDPLNASTPLNI